MLSHRRKPSMCATLTWQKGILERLQATKDQQPVPSSQPFRQASNDFTTRPADPEPHTDREEEADAAAMRMLDQLLDGDDPD